jgi:tetratricopeptide (TPR) repeat protein
MDGATAESLLVSAEQDAPQIRGGADPETMARAVRLLPQMSAAIDWFVEQDRPDDGFRLASALVPIWMATKRLDEGADWFARALARDGGSEARRARAAYDHGYLVFWAGDDELAERRFTEARARAEALADADLVALALAGSARVALRTDPAEAVRLLHAALDGSADLVDSRGRSSAMHVLGVALQMSGDLEGARAIMRDELELARAQGDDFVVWVESANLSMVERKLGDLDAAESLSRDALHLVIRRRDELAIPWVLNGLAAVVAARGAHERAAALLAAAEALLERAGGEWPPDEREQHDETVAVLTGALAPHELGRARAAAAAMSLDDVIADALA